MGEERSVLKFDWNRQCPVPRLRGHGSHWGCVAYDDPGPDRRMLRSA